MEKVINNAISFVFAYLFVFAVAQISTILPAFSHEVPVIVYSSYLDFNTLTSANSDEVWKSVDNVIIIFGSAILLLCLLMFVSMVLLLKWRSKRIWIQKLLFWIIICSFIRFCNGFICGHIFNLWGFNLVTDFIGLTFPSNIMKLVFVIIIFMLLLVGMYFFRQIVEGIINPYSNNLKKELKDNVLYPVVIGSLLIFFIFFPLTKKDSIIEVFNIFITPLTICTLFKMGVMKRYTFEGAINIESIQTKEKINIALLTIVALISITIRVIFDKGVKITPNTYDNYILDNLLSVVVIASSFILIAYLFFAQIHHRRKQKEEREELENLQKQIEEMKDHNIFNYNSSTNLDKYHKAWQEMDENKK